MQSVRACAAPISPLASSVATSVPNGTSSRLDDAVSDLAATAPAASSATATSPAQSAF